VAEDAVLDAAAQRFDHRRRRAEIHIRRPQRYHVAPGVLLPAQTVCALPVHGNVEIEVHRRTIPRKTNAGGGKRRNVPRFVSASGSQFFLRRCPEKRASIGSTASQRISDTTLWQRHPKVFAYLPRQVVVHLAVARNSAASV